MMLCKKIGMKLIIYPVKSKEQEALPSNDAGKAFVAFTFNNYGDPLMNK
ncbi:hypothetical protein BRLA_c037630 [Brevibacillus laterosporus LMG 15441]|uniref:Uncharacterized protein n=1 Tax=Brevibacillus laterosporus LMG 15441 TaxID=1042163 RepID=A0A075R9X4_BRELA|nr:hypothetical protein BRLA_c037630 [Brevibacillus laterosporus LMG 15441]